MRMPGTEDKEKLRKEKARQAVALAMQNRWEDAVTLNRAIAKDFPQDMEAYNRLGKALSELGRNREAREAFQKALEISPNNSIARKNFERLGRLRDGTPRAQTKSTSAPHVFIEESGKAGVTALVNLAESSVLLKLAPGHPVELHQEGRGIKVTDPSDEYIGKVEPKLASRLVKLINGGNRYNAVVTSAAQHELTIIIRETYKHPSQSGIVSFPSKSGTDYRVYLPSQWLGPELGDEDGEESEAVTVKDWSDDDTEPGDDDAFSPVLHRIINANDEGGNEDDDF